MRTQHKIALARVAYLGIRSARSLVGLTDAAIVTRRGLSYSLDLREGIDFAIFLLGSFEPRTVGSLDRLIRPGMTILDIGANVGAHTLHMARAAGEGGRVIAFEPTEFAFEKLSQNIALNPEIAKRIHAIRCFLADDESAVPLEICSSWPLTGGEHLHPGHLGATNSTNGAAAARLDTILRQSGISRVDLVKMDVDGYECSVLSGAAEMMARDKPIFLFEFAPDLLAEQGATAARFLEFFNRLDYRFTDADTDRAISASELIALDLKGASRNIIARVGT